MRRTLAVGLAAATLVAMSSTALAATGISSADDGGVSSGSAATGSAGSGTLSTGDAALPTVASDSRGHVVAAWYVLTSSGTTVAARLSSDGGVHWGRAQNLGKADLAQGDERPTLVRAAVDARGDAIVVWARVVSGRMAVEAATAGPGRAFGAARTVSNAAVDARHPAVTASGQRFIVAWTGDATVEDAIVSATGSITSRSTIARGQNTPDQVSVAADGARRLALAWNVNRGVDEAAIVARQTIGSGPAVLSTLSAQAIDGPIGLALAATGRTTVTWTDMQNAATDSQVVKARSAAWGKGFSAAQQLSTSGMLAITGGDGGGSRGIGIDDAGHVSVVWVEVMPFGVKGGGRVAVATSDTAGKFGKARTVQSVKDPLTYERPAITVAPKGGITATWTLYHTLAADPSGGIWAARSNGSGAFSKPITVSGVSGDASAVATANQRGDAVMVWELTPPKGGTTSVQYRDWTRS